MFGKGLNYDLIKTTRFTGWLLLPLMLLFIITGYAITGKFGMNKVIDAQKALAVHDSFDLPLIAVFLVHALAGMLFAFRRWGWLSRPKKT